MEPEALKGLLVLLLVLAIWWLASRERYPMKVCPRCRGDGREFQKDTWNYRTCTVCQGQKAIPR